MKSFLINRLSACLLALLLVGVSVPVGAFAGVDTGHATMDMEDCNDAEGLISHAGHCCLIQIPLGSSEPVLSQPIDYVEQATIEPEERQSGTLPNPLFRPPRLIG
ncbi:MAG: hypothetical protein ACKVH7_06525 [Alphaproteobacteria bacterium]